MAALRRSVWVYPNCACVGSAGRTNLQRNRRGVLGKGPANCFIYKSIYAFVLIVPPWQPIWWATMRWFSPDLVVWGVLIPWILSSTSFVSHVILTCESLTGDEHSVTVAKPLLWYSPQLPLNCRISPTTNNIGLQILWALVSTSNESWSIGCIVPFRKELWDASINLNDDVTSTRLHSAQPRREPLPDQCLQHFIVLLFPCW